MSGRQYIVLEDRGVLALTGPDRIEFLQGLVSNDMRKLAPNRALHTAFLTPQGKYLHDFFAVQRDEVMLLDCERARIADLTRRLAMYKLRSRVEISDVTANLAVVALIGLDVAPATCTGKEAGCAAPMGGGVAFIDPRLAQAGARVLLPRGEVATLLADAGFFPAAREIYDSTRIRLGLFDGSRDQEIEKAVLLENGYDELGSVDWNKGCYLGQELTARTRYRGLVKKRLLPVSIAGPRPEAGSPVTLNGEEVGEVRSVAGGWALVLLRLEALAPPAGGPRLLTAGEAVLTPHPPEWVKLPARE